MEPRGGFGGPAGSAAPGAPPPSPVTDGAMTLDEGDAADGFFDKKGVMDTREEEKEKAPDEAAAHEGQSEGAPATRAWFPESFVWMPLLETDAAGNASVTVTVPDTLTTWRLLALAQSERGGQGGATATFRSTLPAYLEVSTPGSLYAGDRLDLPVQIVNQEAGPLTGRVSVSVTGGTGSAAGTVNVASYGSEVRTFSVGATSPGELRVHAELAGVDAVERSITVLPNGRPIDTSRGGTLAGPRTFSMDALPGGLFPSLDLVGFPGALSLISREVELAEGRGDDIANASYSFALSLAAGPLTGEGAVTADSLRTLSIHSVQRLTRLTRSPDSTTAAIALAGLKGADPDSLAGHLADRLADTLTQAQQPDGLWAVPSGAALDQALIVTARAVWALGPDAKGQRLRASGATERYAERLQDPTVAAWALAAGILDPGAEAAARATVIAAIETAPDGSKRLPGSRHVSTAEATAVALLALTGEDALRSDLAAGLLASWPPGQGFSGGGARGSGALTNLVALRAINAAMGGEIPSAVTIRLTVDGVEVAHGELDPSQPHAPLHLRGPGLSGSGSAADGGHTIKVTAEPAVPGLFFTLTARSWLPWQALPSVGLEIQAEPEEQLRVGVEGGILVTATGPADSLADLDIHLPAGVDVDRSELESALSGLVIQAWRAGDGIVHLDGVRLSNGQIQLRIPVTPTLAGALASGPASITAPNLESWVRVPEIWSVR